VRVFDVRVVDARVIGARVIDVGRVDALDGMARGEQACPLACGDSVSSRVARRKRSDRSVTLGRR
jgi:hypothetical protein